MRCYGKMKIILKRELFLQGQHFNEILQFINEILSKQEHDGRKESLEMRYLCFDLDSFMK